MAYTLNIPLSTDLQSVSQGQIEANFNQLNTSFGIDHYPFTTVAPNTGFHNKVTTPPILVIPAAVGTNPQFFALTSGNMGIVQYSLGTVQNVPSPITYFQSAPGPLLITKNGGTLDILDCAGLTRGIFQLYAFNEPAVNNVRAIGFAFWSGAGSPLVGTTSNAGGFSFQNNGGTKIQLLNSNVTTDYANTYWTLLPMRLS